MTDLRSCGFDTETAGRIAALAHPAGFPTVMEVEVTP